MSRKRSFPMKDVKKLVALLEKQGCKTKPTKAGYWIGFPNGQSTSFHLTSSDPRTLANVKACVIRNGCTWPL
jgi:hypothetical protein